MTKELIETDEAGRSFLWSKMVNDFDNEGYVLSRWDVVTDSRLGSEGIQHRVRLRMHFEKHSMAAALGPAPPLTSYAKEGPPRKISEILEAPEAGSHMGCKGRYEPNNFLPKVENWVPQPIGALVWGGKDQPVIEGSIITLLKGDGLHWRVTHFYSDME